MKTLTAKPLAKFYRYRVTSVSGPGKKSVKVGDVLLYKRGRGRTHFETIMDIETGRITQVWWMSSIGPCWVRGKKIVRKIDRERRTEDAP